MFTIGRYPSELNSSGATVSGAGAVARRPPLGRESLRRELQHRAAPLNRARVSPAPAGHEHSSMHPDHHPLRGSAAASSPITSLVLELLCMSVDVHSPFSFFSSARRARQHAS